MYNRTIATILACAVSFWIGYEMSAYQSKVEFAQFLNKLNDSRFK
jgi:hypothetical protein